MVRPADQDLQHSAGLARLNARASTTERNDCGKPPTARKCLKSFVVFDAIGSSMRISIIAMPVILSGFLIACHTPHAPHDLPHYTAPSPTIDNDDWTGTQSQAPWKERGNQINDDLLRQAIHGTHY